MSQESNDTNEATDTGIANDGYEGKKIRRRDVHEKNIPMLDTKDSSGSHDEDGPG